MDLHNELSYSPNPPKFIMFFCESPTTRGGQTPIASSVDIYQSIDHDIRQEFEEKGIKYITNLPSKKGGHHLGLTWQDTYNEDTPQGVERFCMDKGISFQWVHPRNGEEVARDSELYKNHEITLRTERIFPAVRNTMNGERIWFNHSHLFHPSDLSSKVRDSINRYLPSNLLPKMCYLGNGDEIPDSHIQSIRSTLRDSEVVFNWEKGDVMVLDNYLISHGRRPYQELGRRILVSMK